MKPEELPQRFVELMLKASIDFNSVIMAITAQVIATNGNANYKVVANDILRHSRMYNGQVEEYAEQLLGKEK